MKTFLEWLAYTTDLFTRLPLTETYYSFDAQQYNQLFDQELAKLMGRVASPDHRAALERMRGFGWVGYIAQCVRNAGWYDQREVQERTHDIIVKLLMGGLFRGFDERTAGPIDLRFKRSVANAIKNIAEKERNRRRLLPTVSLGNEWRPDAEDVPDRASAAQGDDTLVRDFRRLVQTRLGEVGLAVLDARLVGQETKGLVGREDLGSPGIYTIKKLVQQIKALARQYAASVGNPILLQAIEKAMAREEATVEKRRATTVARQGR